MTAQSIYVYMCHKASFCQIYIRIDNHTLLCRHSRHPSYPLCVNVSWTSGSWCDYIRELCTCLHSRLNNLVRNIKTGSMSDSSLTVETDSGITLCMRLFNERQRYLVTSSFICWAHRTEWPLSYTMNTTDRQNIDQRYLLFPIQVKTRYIYAFMNFLYWFFSCRNNLETIIYSFNLMQYYQWKRKTITYRV